MDSVQGDVLTPKVLIVPTETPITQLNSPIGTLIMSGAKLYVCTAVGTYELVTSA
jgi:hypothetical protein